MNSWKVIFATLVIFGAGVVTGGLLVSHVIHVNTPPPFQQRAGSGPMQQGMTPWQLRNRDLVRRMENELALTTAQRGRIEQLILDSQDRTKYLWKPIVPQMNHEMQNLHGLIREELTSDQQKKFDELFKQRQPRKPDDATLQRLREQRRGTNFPGPDAPFNNPAPAESPQ